MPFQPLGINILNSAEVPLTTWCEDRFEANAEHPAKSEVSQDKASARTCIGEHRRACRQVSQKNRRLRSGFWLTTTTW